MKMLSINDLIVFVVWLTNQKEFNDEQLEVIGQFNHLQTDVAGALVLCGLGIPLITMLTYIGFRLWVAFNQSRSRLPKQTI